MANSIKIVLEAVELQIRAYLHLVNEHECAVLIAFATQLTEPLFSRRCHAAFALDRLDHDQTHLVCDLIQGGVVVEHGCTESRHQRRKRLLVIL